MAVKRTRKPATIPVPFADAGAAVTEAAFAPVKAAGLVSLPDAESLPLAVAATETLAIDAAAEPVAALAPEPAEAASPEPEPEPVIAASPEPEPEPAAPELAAAAEPTAPPPAETEIASTPSKPAMIEMAPTFLKGLMTMATAPETTYAATDRMQAMFGDVNERAKTAVEKSTKFAEEMTEFTKGNVEAFVASGRVAAKGAEAMTQEAAEYGKKSFESATATLKSFAAVKSPTELFQLQSDYAKSSFDAIVAEASKVSESMLKLMGEIAQPLSSRYAVAAEKIKSASSL